MELWKAWVFGDKLGAPAFQNAIMDQLIWHHETAYLLGDAQVVDYVYGNTIPGSPLRLLLVNLYGQYQGGIITSMDEWCKLFHSGGDFVVDLMKTLLDRKSIGEPRQNVDLWLGSH